MEPSGSVRALDDWPVRDAARVCRTSLLWLQSNVSGLGGIGPQFRAVRDCVQRFDLWAGYMGVFADGDTSLESRLRFHPEIRQPILNMLALLERNLDHDFWLDGNALRPHSPGLGQARRQRLDETAAQDAPVDTSRPSTSLAVVAALDAIQAALDRLERLAVLVRNLPSSCLAPSMVSPASLADPVEVRVFQHMASVLVTDRFPGIGGRLAAQLISSIVFRRLRLLQHAKQKNLKSRLVAPAQRGVDTTFPIQVPVLQEPEAPQTRIPPRSEMDMFSLDFDKSSHQDFAHTDFSDTSTASSSSQCYPYPPLPQPRTKSGEHYMCDWCVADNKASDLAVPGWWRAYLQKNLQPYVCISEDCSEPAVFFESYSKWRQHMESVHTTDWARIVHCPHVWYCDDGPHDYIEFRDKHDLKQHLNQHHAKDLNLKHFQRKITQTTAENPNVIVSVDLGTTCTGVAWRTPRTPVQVINDWPGSGDRGERKVPSSLIYNADGSLSSWGFLCADDDNWDAGRTRRDLFKLFLDNDAVAVAQEQGLVNAPSSAADAKRCTTDYLRKVYAHVKETIERHMGLRRQMGSSWADLVVLFLFSVPTTWTRMKTIIMFKDVIRAAGFGTEGLRHEAQVDLTKAEAAAVTTLKTSVVRFTAGSLFLTVDAGGGTTDLALMRITSTDAAVPQMEQVAAVRGVGIGSTLIDRAFIRLVARRLAAWPEIERQLLADVAVRMARSHHFLNLKHKFGEILYMQSVWKIPMDGVSHAFNHDGLGIENGCFLVTKEQMQSLFDTQIEGLKKEIKAQLDWLSENGHPDLVEFVVLSGGLGSSCYVRDRIQQHLMSFPYPNAPRAVVILCQDPQLVVVRGLLLNQQQRTETGYLSVLATRVARASYGIVVKQPYRPSNHFDEEIVKDPFDSKKRWAINQIQWLIHKGDNINPNSPLVKTFKVYLAEQDITRSWDADVVISQNEISFLPHSLKQAGVTKLCQIKSNLEGVQQHQLILRKKRGTCFRRGYRFYICEFDVRVIVGPADLRFELWFDGQKFSGNNRPISVSWNEAGLEVGAD
ncbi:Hsp70 family chaperone [Hirsutella rhossiliensis]|uniref:Hsp70 family chaperone n=1 Tax=Hirsutella rhossiliensis TaxID=111463 RepID=A0A9P8SHF7_9HYPO|nr:Hsp70 family chaperone [Hirsutella rhossiliensis]KAH0962791.1 Hsp70 family chaperone [Hirsutella rhossiliensis]